MKYIKNLCFSIVFFILFFFSQAKTQEKDADWISLFNGRNLDGWIVKAVSADKDFSFWSVKDGVIEAFSIGYPDHDYVWLVTKDEYSDFVLKLKFLAFRNSPGNSGIQIRSRYDDKAEWLDGPQIDIHPPDFWRTGMIWDETRENKRWLYPVIPKDAWVDSTMAVKGIEFYYSDKDTIWNDLQITAHGTCLRAVLNSVLVMEWDGTGVLDDEIHKKYEVGLNGHIALQIHKNDELIMQYKDIYLKKLK